METNLADIFGNSAGDAELSVLLVNLGASMLMSFILSWHYRRFGSGFSNRTDLCRIFPILVPTTVLIIMVIKSSVALSLGLVGALSIIRFRTPIKEPEELAYLFLAVALGLGFGSGLLLGTGVAALVILVVVAVWQRTTRDSSTEQLFVSLDWEVPEGSDLQPLLDRMGQLLSRHAEQVNLRRFDFRAPAAEATFLLHRTSYQATVALLGELQASFPSVGVTFLNQRQLPAG